MAHHPERLEVRADMRAKKLFINGREVGAPGRHEWVWWQEATTFLTQAQQDVGASWIAIN